MDSYRLFMENFKISKDDLFDWGIENTIFPNVEVVDVFWNKLKDRIVNGEKVYIRGYGRDAHGTELYKGLYGHIFGNFNVIKDPTNNAIPQKNIQNLTSKKRNVEIYNYQVSHIFGRTKNIFMFEAPWNVCYTPKIMDPFTGHESKGEWPVEYQDRFIKKAVSLYEKYIIDYNLLLKKYEMKDRTNEYINNLFMLKEKKEVDQFKNDCEKEIEPIVI